jgi:hypothetical protein
MQKKVDLKRWAGHISRLYHKYFKDRIVIGFCKTQNVTKIDQNQKNSLGILQLLERKIIGFL